MHNMDGNHITDAIMFVVVGNREVVHVIRTIVIVSLIKRKRKKMNEEEKERQEAIADIAEKIKHHESEINRLNFVAASFGFMAIREKPKQAPVGQQFQPGRGWGAVIHQPKSKRLYFHSYMEDGLSSNVNSVDCEHQPYCDTHEEHKIRK